MLVNGATQDVMRLRNQPNLGVLSSPRGRHSPEYIRATGLPWAMDNDAYSKQGFSAAAYMDRLYELRHLCRCVYVVVPDAPRDAVKTMELFVQWVSFVRYLGYPPALAAQDGIERLPIPWSLFDVLFIGGSTEWKLGPHAHRLIVEAKQRGKWVHVGRVNSHKRIRLVKSMGADSFDGTNMSIEPRQIAAKLPTAQEPVTVRMLL